MQDAGTRRLGLRDVVAVAVSAMVGVGIFFNPKDVAARAGDGPRTLLVWVLGGVVAILGALTFAELGGRLPKAGGQFRVLREAFGPKVGVTYMVVVGVVESSAAVAILAIVCGKFLAVACGMDPDAKPVPPLLGPAPPAMLILAAFGLAAMGVKQGAAALSINVALKLLTAVLIIGLAVFGAPDAAAHGGASAVDAVGAAAGAAGPAVDAARTGGGLSLASFAWLAAFLPAFFAYGGFQQSLWIGGEVRNPERNLPRGIVIGVAIVVAVYVGLNAAYLRLLGYEGVAGAQAVAAEAAGVVFPWAGRATAAVVAWSAFGCMQAILFTGPHQLVALAEDGFAPRALAVRTSRGAPVRAAACYAFVAASLAFLAGPGGVGMLLDAVVCVDWIFFTLTGIALFVLRRRTDLPLPFRVPGYPIVPALFVGAAALAALSPFFDEAARIPGFIALGAVVLVGALASIRFKSVRRSRADG